MTVTIKLNNLVRHLTGRSDGFANPLLNTQVNVAPAGDARVEFARELLRLDVRGTDFYTYGALLSLYSSLYYVRDLDVEHQAAFVPGVFPLEITSGKVYLRTNGEIIYDNGIPMDSATTGATWAILPFYDESRVSVFRNVMQWDSPHDALHMDLNEPNGVMTVTKYWLGTAGESQVFPVTVNVEELTVFGHSQNYTTVAVDAFDFAGLRAKFVPLSDVVHYDLPTPPVIYPYGLVRERIANEMSLVQLMHEVGTIEAFHEAVSDTIAVGALAAAIVRKVRENSGDPTYEVTPDQPAVSGLPVEMQVPVKFEQASVSRP